MSMPTKIGDTTYLSVSEAVEVMGCTDGYVRRLCREGKIDGALRHGERAWLIPQAAAKDAKKSMTTRSVGKRSGQ